MEFELSTDQEALRDAARQLLEGHSAVERARRIVGTGAVDGSDPDIAEGQGRDGSEGWSTSADRAVRTYDSELWSLMVDQGWPAVEEPADAGGLGLGMVEVAVLCEEIGRTVAPVPFAGHCLAVDLLRQACRSIGDVGDVGGELSAWCDRLTRGEAIACLAFAKGRVGANASDLAVGERVALSSACRPEPTIDAPVSDLAIVVADEGVFAVDLSGARPSAQPAMDRTRPVGWLRFDGATAVALGRPEAARRALDRAATASAAELLGAASRALELSVAYGAERVQFGHAVGSFQAIKHRLADALVDVEGMRSTVYYAAWCLAADQPDASLAASSAKAWCSDAGRRVMASALQVHGGIGFTWEHDLHLFVKRAQLDAVSFGDAAFHRDRLGTLLAERPADAPALF